MVFVPDLSSAYVDEFAEVPTLSMIGDVFVIDLPENRRFDQDPRNVAYHAQEYMKMLGIADEMRIGPEFEFHVFDHVSYSVNPNGAKYRVYTNQAEWNTGAEGHNLGYKMAKKGGYHMAPPMDTLSFNLYNLTEEEKKKIRQLPRSLDESLDALVADHEFLTAGDVFPKRLIEIWVANKRSEAARYNQLPQPVEFEMYYDL